MLDVSGPALGAKHRDQKRISEAAPILRISQTTKGIRAAEVLEDGWFAHHPSGTRRTGRMKDRSPGSRSSIPCQLGELNEVAAGVVQHRNRCVPHVGGRHREPGAAGLNPLVVAPDAVGEKHRRGLTLLEDCLLALAAGLLFSANCSSVPSASSGETTVSQRNGPLLKSAFLVKPSTSV